MVSERQGEPSVAGAARESRGRAGHAVHLDGIQHQYGGVVAVRSVSMEVQPGELVALLGPSGCGKTTLLRIIAGFVEPTQGHIRVDGIPVTNTPPHKRGVGIVFQNYALFPHMTVEQNIAYGLEARGATREVVASTVDRMVGLVHLGGMRTRYPRELSGGQQQRVALARALSISPSILLLDEPFGALDKNLRLDMQFEIRRLQRELGITTILVTHDQEEAMSMADRIAVMHQGTIEQLASPVDIYDKPATIFVNTFVGATNLLEGQIAEVSGPVALFQVPGAGALRVPARPEIGKGASAVLSVRPENFEISQDDQHLLRGRVRVSIPLGALTIYEVELAGGQVVKVTAPRHAESAIHKDGDEVGLGLRSEMASSLFAGRA